MSIRMNINLNTSQNLVMTPALQQAIKVLELNQIEIAGYIEEQLLSNPMLAASKGDGEQDWESPDEGGLLQAADDTTPEDSDDWDRPEGGSVDDALGSEDFHQSSEHVDSNYENTFDVGYGDRLINARPDGAYDEDTTAWEERTAGTESLHELLMRQINTQFSDGRDRLIAMRFCHYLTDAGWLGISLEDFTEAENIAKTKANAILKKIQQFEPSGIFGRNLAECLSIQLKQQNLMTPTLAVLMNNLALLSEGKHNKLMKMCRCGAEEMRDMIADIRRMNPKPAAHFDDLPTQHVVPDVFCRKGEDGEWVVELNEQNLPRVLVDRHYYAHAVKGATGTIDKQYLNEQLQNANWLCKALHQRATTILKVATAVVNHQFRFLEHGVLALEPLILQDIADIIHMHPSTISRATQNKYISTPRGVFELKYLFQTSIESSNPNVRFSAEAIRHRIKMLIKEEDRCKPISDDSISDTLNKEGICLARRTIAKYREEMNIPSSSKRKRLHLADF